MLYAVMSVITLVVYAVDKSLARRRSARVSERTLLLLGLAGGWPGAIIAQEIFRHKTVKASFRSVFFATVILNLSIFVTILCLP